MLRTRRRRFIAGSVLSGLGALALSAALARPAPAMQSAYQRARAIGAQAYVYGLAVLDERRVISNFPPNHLISVTQMSDPSEQLIPAPNVDTLYTVAQLSLNAGPLVLHVPDEHGRYYVIQLLDAYTNSFAYIGMRTTGTKAGNFAIVGPRWHGSLPVGMRRIRSPTPTVWLLGRTLVKGPADLGAVNAIQRGYALTPLTDFGGPPLVPLFVQKSMLSPVPLPAGLDFYAALGSAMRANPPPRSETGLMRLFASVGIGPDRNPSTERLAPTVRQGLLAGLTYGRRQLDRYTQGLISTSAARRNGWLLPPSDTGNYGEDFLLRAYVAENALGANVPAEAMYPFAFVDRSLKKLSGAHRYVLHFAAGRLPPVKAFWSLTMYDRNLFLVPNPLARYAVGDRTRTLRRNRDGSLDILMQHSPPRSGSMNWLPAPAGQFVVALRLYEPRASVLSGAWPLPTITRRG